MIALKVKRLLKELESFGWFPDHSIGLLPVSFSWYASPVWAALPNCLVQLVEESVQKSALGIIFPDCSYESAQERALVRCGLLHCCRAVMSLARVLYLTSRSPGSFHSLPQPTNVAHGYGLRSGFPRSEFRLVRTDRLSNFVTHSYNRI